MLIQGTATDRADGKLARYVLMNTYIIRNEKKITIILAGKCMQCGTFDLKMAKR